MEKKKQNFTRTILWTLVAGFITGIIAIIARETLIAQGHSTFWTTLDNLFFTDISQNSSASALGLFYVIGQIFLRLLQLVLVPLIFTSIVRAIQDLASTAVLGQLARKTLKSFASLLAIALGLATVVGYTVFRLGFFRLDGLDTITATAGTANANNPMMLIVDAFSVNLLGTLSGNGNILAVVVLAIIVGILIQTLGTRITVLRKAIDEVFTLAMKLLEFVIIRFSPIAIFCLLVRTFAAYGINYLKPALIYMTVTTLTLLTLLFVIFPIIVKVRGHYDPKRFLTQIRKVAAFAFSTSSSAATLPLTQSTVINDLGVDRTVGSFVVPLASAINMTGTAVMQIIATLFVAAVGGYTIGLPELLLIIALTVIGSISTPAAPGAGAILLFTILTGMNFTNPAAMAAYTFILAINRPVEMLVTAVNVVDDAVSSVCIQADLNAASTTITTRSDADLDTETLSPEHI